jgi:NAD(P)-dependent dehydrogenase (short-subunit alcohol dehydrogenase family)
MNRVLITGANRGLGFELVQQFVDRGDRVFAGCRSPEKAFSLEELVGKFPGQVTILPLDVVDQWSIEKSLDLVEAEVDALDILINNAAIHLGDEPLSEVKADVLLRTLQINAIGMVLMVQKFVGFLQKGDNPKLINISSQGGSLSLMNHFRGFGYSGSKAALNMYTRCLALEPEMEGITIIALHPGWMRTDMGGPDAPLTTAKSAEGVLRVIEALTKEDNGKFFTWEGKELPW